MKNRRRLLVESRVGRFTTFCFVSDSFFGSGCCHMIWPILLDTLPSYPAIKTIYHR